MIDFAELAKTVDQLSEDELDELREIIRKRKEREMAKLVEEARQESKDGKTIVLDSPEEIKSFFNNLEKE